MRPNARPGKCRPSRYWTAIAGAALVAAVLVGCGGDDGADGAAGATGPAGPAGPAGSDGKDLTAVVQVPSNSTAATGASTAAWAALAPQVTITSVTISSKPVVKFSVKDAAGIPVVGLGSKSKSATATVATMPNIAFTLAKLVPATTQTAGTSTVVTEPGKWVSYLVARPPTVAEKTAVPNARVIHIPCNINYFAIISQ